MALRSQFSLNGFCDEFRYGERVEATLEGLKRPHGVFTTAIVDWNVHEWDEMSKTVVVASLALMEAGADLARFRSLPCDILYHNASAVPCPWQPPASAASEVGEQSQEMFKDDPWKVVENVDAVYGAGPHSALLGTATSVAACEDLCDKQAGCNIWTWNHEVRFASRRLPSTTISVLFVLVTPASRLLNKKKQRMRGALVSLSLTHC